MIPAGTSWEASMASKPRASGDDPAPEYDVFDAPSKPRASGDDP